MVRLVVSRFFEAIPVWVCILTLTFVIARVVPGGPFDADVQSNSEVQLVLKSYYGYDQPVWVQYCRYMKNLLMGNLGPSMRYQGYTVNELLAQRIPVSIELGFWTMLSSILIGLGLGVIAAFKYRSWLDWLTTGLSTATISLPVFVIGPLLILLFGIKLHWFQVVGWEEPCDRILPTLTLTAMYTGYVTRLTRGSLLEVVRQNFIRTALAKGLSNTRIFCLHALRNALSPVLNYLGPTAAGIVSGSLVIESLFNINGVGSLFITAVGQRDDALILGTVLYFSTLIIIFNLVVDIILIVLNPTQKSA
jgi:oligopeptide transport system permease protein